MNTTNLMTVESVDTKSIVNAVPSLDAFGLLVYEDMNGNLTKNVRPKPSAPPSGLEGMLLTGSLGDFRINVANSAYILRPDGSINYRNSTAATKQTLSHIVYGQVYCHVDGTWSGLLGYCGISRISQRSRWEGTHRHVAEMGHKDTKNKERKSGHIPQLAALSVTVSRIGRDLSNEEMLCFEACATMRLIAMGHDMGNEYSGREFSQEMIDDLLPAIRAYVLVMDILLRNKNLLDPNAIAARIKRELHEAAWESIPSYPSFELPAGGFIDIKTVKVNGRYVRALGHVNRKTHPNSRWNGIEDGASVWAGFYEHTYPSEVFAEKSGDNVILKELSIYGPRHGSEDLTGNKRDLMLLLESEASYDPMSGCWFWEGELLVSKTLPLSVISGSGMDTSHYQEVSSVR